VESQNQFAFGNGLGIELWIVVAIGCDLPGDKNGKPLRGERNNVILQGLETGRIVLLTKLKGR